MRAARGPSGDPVGLKAAILSDPSIVEKGLRILDDDLRAGASGSIDLIGIDRAGALALIAIAADDPGATLLRLLDQYRWMGEQRDLLARAYSKSGMMPNLPVRCLLLAPGFTHAFLQRLSLLTVDVFPYLARRARTRGGGWLVEPAAPIFGFRQAEEESGAGSDAPARLLGVPEADSGGPHDEAERGGAEQDGTADVEVDHASLVPFEDMPPASEPPEPLPGIPLSSEADPAQVLETLTAEELEEFERFDRQRREGQRGAS